MAIVTSQAELQSAVENTDPEIIVANDIHMSSPITISYPVTFTGGEGASLLWSGSSVSQPDLFIVLPEGELTMESLTLDGENRDGTLVFVNGGVFIMNQGTVLHNLRSTTAQSAVKIGSITERTGGSFEMNGGVITGVTATDSVFSADGTVVMRGDATIQDNMASGVLMIWSSLTMEGQSRIAGNQSKQAGAGCAAVESHIIMGVSEGDAPAIIGNRSPHDCGGVFLTNDSSLTMRFGATISDNHSPTFAAGVGAQHSTITLEDDASIANNLADGEAAGLLMSEECTVALSGRAVISGNTSSGRGGGVYLQKGAVLRLTGSAAVRDNTARDGGGIYLNESAVYLGDGDSTPVVSGNIATEKGGGVFLSSGSQLDLSGQAAIFENEAEVGLGVYKAGELTLSQSPQILDGLYFNVPLPDDAQPWPVGNMEASSYELGTVIIIDPITMDSTPADGEVKAPVIAGALTERALLRLEASSYVAPENVPLTIAEKGAPYTDLSENDRAAWRLPENFGPEHSVILSESRQQVLAAYASFPITYKNVVGVENPNPAEYTAGDLPIELLAPGPRRGYLFAGWLDGQGQRVTEIPAGTIGAVTLAADWETFALSFNGNGRFAVNMPDPIPLLPGETVRIPCAIPRRRGFFFLCWCTSPRGPGDVYVPGSAVRVGEEGVVLYARWLPANCCRCHICCLRRICSI